MRKTLEREARRCQAEWDCPRQEGGSTGGKARSAKALRVLACVEDLTGLEPAPDEHGQPRCPKLCLRDQAVLWGALAHEWWSKGQLAILVPDPPQVVLDAVNAVSQGLTARREWDFRRAEERRKAAERDLNARAARTKSGTGRR